MRYGSAEEMRRVLESIKDYARHAKESDCSRDLECYATIDIIEQKLTNSLTRNFRRWVHREHDGRDINVDSLIKFLQKETELKEHLTTKSSNASPIRAKTNLPQFIICALTIQIIAAHYVETNVINS